MQIFNTILILISSFILRAVAFYTFTPPASNTELFSIPVFNSGNLITFPDGSMGMAFLGTDSHPYVAFFTKEGANFANSPLKIVDDTTFNYV